MEEVDAGVCGARQSGLQLLKGSYFDASPITRCPYASHVKQAPFHPKCHPLQAQPIHEETKCSYLS